MIFETEADRENERVVAQAYCDFLGLEQGYYQHTRKHPYDVSVFLDDDFLEAVEVRVRGRTIEWYNDPKNGQYIPIGQLKYNKLKKHSARFLNVIRTNGDPEATVYELRPSSEVESSDYYIDMRPKRVRELVYKVPVGFFKPVVADGHTLKIPVEKLTFREYSDDKFSPQSDSVEAGPYEIKKKKRAA